MWLVVEGPGKTWVAEAGREAACEVRRRWSGGLQRLWELFKQQDEAAG